MLRLSADEPAQKAAQQVRALNHADFLAIVEDLRQDLRSQEPGEAATGATALGRLAESASVAILELLEVLQEHPDAGDRVAAAHALGRIGDGRAVDLLATIVRNPQESAHLRAHCATSLGMIGGTDATSQLIGALGEPEVNVAAAVQNAIRVLDPPPVRELAAVIGGADDGRAVEAAGALLASMGRDVAEVIPSLLAAASQGKSSVTEAVTRVLMDIAGEADAEALFAGLQNKSEATRAVVLRVLIKTPAIGRGRVPRIGGLAHDPNGNIRFLVAEALRKQGPLAQPYLDILREDDDAKVSQVARDAYDEAGQGPAYD